MIGPSGIEVLGPFDVKVAANENYAAWEALLAANPDAKAKIGLCAPDIEFHSAFAAVGRRAKPPRAATSARPFSKAPCRARASRGRRSRPPAH